MGTTRYRTGSSYRSRGSLRDRIIAAILAVALVALLLLALALLGVIPGLPPGEGKPLTTFDVLPPGQRSAEPTRAAARPSPATRRSEPRKAVAVRPRVAPPEPVVPMPPNMIILSRADFAAADIGKIRSAPGTGEALAANRGGGGGGADTGDDAGAGPGGERMYNAEWVREPTHAEMAFYIPPGKIGWGLIACRAIPRNRVDDCRLLGESPPGSGIGRGVREAAWQFQIRPPRVNGEPKIGAWIRIKYDIRQGTVK